MLSEEQVIAEVADRYLHVYRPAMEGEAYRIQLAPFISLSERVSDKVVASLLLSSRSSWREQLIALALAMCGRPETFIEPMLKSLESPRGFSIAPTLAALAVAVKNEPEELERQIVNLNRKAFDGELGWAADMALARLGRLPNAGLKRVSQLSGVAFDDYMAILTWLATA